MKTRILKEEVLLKSGETEVHYKVQYLRRFLFFSLWMNCYCYNVESGRNKYIVYPEIAKTTDLQVAQRFAQFFSSPQIEYYKGVKYKKIIQRNNLLVHCYLSKEGIEWVGSGNSWGYCMLYEESKIRGLIDKLPEKTNRIILK